MEATHILFKGIPVTGTVESFAEKLQSIGFSCQKTEDRSILCGVFANKNCSIILKSTVKTNQIWQVIVLMDPIYESWIQLKDDYNLLKTMYIKKYGQPSNDFQYFLHPYIEGDGNEDQALKEGYVCYGACFDTNEGSVLLRIFNNTITIGYEDNINRQLNQDELEVSIMEDI